MFRLHIRKNRMRSPSLQKKKKALPNSIEKHRSKSSPEKSQMLIWPLINLCVISRPKEALNLA